MKKLFLSSSVFCVANSIAKEIKRKGLKLLFITTASEVEEGDLWWLRKDRKSLVDAGFIVTDYTITDKIHKNIEDKIKASDVISVSGGNVFYLLQKIQETKSFDIFRKYVEGGKTYIGSSAGSMIAGPDIYPAYSLDRIEDAPNLKGYKALGLVDFVVFPHWGNEKFRERYLNQRLEHAYTTDNKIILLTDYQYVKVIGDTYKIVDVRKNKNERV